MASFDAMRNPVHRPLIVNRAMVTDLRQIVSSDVTSLPISTFVIRPTSEGCIVGGKNEYPVPRTLKQAGSQMCCRKARRHARRPDARREQES